MPRLCLLSLLAFTLLLPCAASAQNWETLRTVDSPAGELRVELDLIDPLDPCLDRCDQMDFESPEGRTACEDKCFQVEAPPIAARLTQKKGEQKHIIQLDDAPAECEYREGSIELLEDPKARVLVDVRYACANGEDYFSAEANVVVLQLEEGTSKVLWRGKESSSSEMGVCVSDNFISLSIEGDTLRVTRTTAVEWHGEEGDDYLKEECFVQKEKVSHQEISLNKTQTTPKP